MDNMGTTLSILEQYPEAVYGLSVCILSWILLQYFIHKPTKKLKISVVIISGVFLGFLYYFIVDVIRWPMMILSFLASVGFYELIWKVIMKKLKLSYQDN